MQGTISVSNALAERMYTDFNIESTVISNWLPEEEYNKPFRKIRPKNERVFMFVGRFSIEKNPILLLEAAKELLARGYLNEVRFFGYGPLKSNMLEYIRSNKIDSFVSISETSTNILDEMQHADCIVIPSLSESFGLVYLEASTNNMSSIVADIPGLNEVTFETHAIKFASNKTLALVEAMITYLKKSDTFVGLEIQEDVKILRSKYGSNDAELSYNKFYNSILRESIKKVKK